MTAKFYTTTNCSRYLNQIVSTPVGLGKVTEIQATKSHGSRKIYKVDIFGKEFSVWLEREEFKMINPKPWPRRGLILR